MMILGRKLGMTHLFDAQGHLQPVTIVGCDKNFIVGRKTVQKDGYLATVVATTGSKHLSQPIQKQLDKAKIKDRVGVMREFRSTEEIQTKFPLGSEIELIAYQPGDRVTVTAISKGKGFAGTIKRHGFARGPKTHGSNNYRQPGSIGAQQPQRVIKGKRMAGHMGHQQVTVANLNVLIVEPAKRLMAISGSLPGPNRGLIEIRKM